MTFEINFNFFTKTWNVWKITRNFSGETISAEVVKRFKSKQAAENWVAKQQAIPKLITHMKFGFPNFIFILGLKKYNYYNKKNPETQMLSI